MTKRKRSKFLASNWVITVTATLIGVFGALFLNEWVSNKKLRNQKSLAAKNVMSEIRANEQTLEKTIKEHAQLYDTMEFLSTYLNESNDLVVHKDTLQKFRIKYPLLVEMKDSTLIEEGVYDYTGEIKMDVSIPNIEITTIAWETLKSSGISATYDFECLMYLETIDKFTTEILKKDVELLEFLSGMRDTGDKNNLILSHLKLLMDYEKSLKEIYKSSEKELKNCS